MPEGIEKLRQKYKLNEETESFFQICLEHDGWHIPSRNRTVYDARRIFDEKTDKFGIEVNFEGAVKEFTVPSATCEGRYFKIYVF